MEKTTEQESRYHQLEAMHTKDILRAMNEEDKNVALAVERCMPQITALVEAALVNMKAGARLFYLGAGTSGRLGILDASECPPTYGVPFDLVNGIIAGGDSAIRKAVEGAEDNRQQGWLDLLEAGAKAGDVAIGITASGTTPYVLGAIELARKNRLLTGGITCNAGAPLSEIAEFPVCCVTGPEFVTGSTRMKAGTAQKMILNMISTSLMIGLGRVKGNKMVDMRLSNAKLWDRGARMLMESLAISHQEAMLLLEKHGSVRAALNANK